jgi:hypothetical protein
MQKTTANFGKTQHAAARSSAPPLMQSPSRLAGLCVAALVSATISAPSWGQIDPDFPGPAEPEVVPCCDGYAIYSYSDGTEEVTKQRGWVRTSIPGFTDLQPCALWKFRADAFGADISAWAELRDARNGYWSCSGEATPTEFLRKAGTRYKRILWGLPCAPTKPALIRFWAEARMATTGRINANDGSDTAGCGGLWALAAVGFEFDSVIDPARDVSGVNKWPGPRGATCITAGGYCEGGITMTAFAGSEGAGVSGSWTWSGDIATQPMNIVLLPSDQAVPWFRWDVCAAFESAVLSATGSVAFVFSASGATEVSSTAQTSTQEVNDDWPVKIQIIEACSNCVTLPPSNPSSTGGHP